MSGSFTHPRFGWSIEVPAEFRASPFGVKAVRGETGVLISNFEVKDPRSLAEFRDFPPDGAALRFWSLEGMVVAPSSDEDSRLPLDLSVLEETTRYVGRPNRAHSTESSSEMVTPTTSPLGSGRIRPAKTGPRSRPRFAVSSSGQPTLAG